MHFSILSLKNIKENDIYNLVYIFLFLYFDLVYKSIQGIDKNKKLKYHFLMSSAAHSAKPSTYFHLVYMLKLFSKTIMNSYYFPSIVFLTEAERHGPALGVIPVLSPLKPLHSILLVFYHKIYLCFFLSKGGNSYESVVLGSTFSSFII